MSESINNVVKKDWDIYVNEFALQLWKERPKKPMVLTFLLLAQLFVIVKNDAYLKMPILYIIALCILFILVIILWTGYIRQIGSWQYFFNEMILGLKSVIENNQHLSEVEMESKIIEFHRSIASGKKSI